MEGCHVISVYRHTLHNEIIQVTGFHQNSSTSTTFQTTAFLVLVIVHLKTHINILQRIKFQHDFGRRHTQRFIQHSGIHHMS